MKAREMLNRLARLHGVETSYLGMDGRRKFASPESLLLVLQALGAPLSSLRDVPDALREKEGVLLSSLRAAF